MLAADAFSPDYATARRRFREAATAHGWAVESHPVAARGPMGEELFIDVAAHSPSDDHTGTLVASSGVHGVEAPFGSAVQLALLERWKANPPVRCVFVHCINPWGFAHRRRTNEDNFDLNRNFLLPGEEYRGSPPGYADLMPLLNPEHPPSRFDPFPLRAAWAVLRHGLPKLKQAVAAGQYDHPKGIFFGGSRPGESVRILGEHWERWLGRSRDVVHLDYHTGLGRRGHFKLLLDLVPTPAQVERLNGWFGPDTYEVCNPHQTAYDARGGIGPWCHARRGEREYLFACAEFGTYGPIRMMGALRAENMAHHWGTAEWATQRLAEAFCPAANDWREQVLTAGCRLAEQAATGLRESAGAAHPANPSA